MTAKNRTVLIKVIDEDEHHVRFVNTFLVETRLSDMQLRDKMDDIRATEQDGNYPCDVEVIDELEKQGLVREKNVDEFEYRGFLE